MHILLIFSVLLTVLSSALVTFIFENKALYKAVCCFSAVLFAEVVLTYELLSLFSAVTPVNVVILNFLSFVFAVLFFLKKGQKPDYKEEIKSEFLKLKSALKQDKWLFAVSAAFLLFIVGSIIFMYFMPINDEDALSYHAARLPFWFAAKNINHFLTTDVRAVIMPINAEVFYFWAYSFIKSDIFVRLFSFLSYLLFLCSLRGFLKTLGYGVKVSLWVIFGISSMQSVMFAITGTETNIAIAALITGGLFLFVDAVKNNNPRFLYFSSLMFALAVGTKTPALMVMPAMLIIMTVSSFSYKKENFYKPIFVFSGLFVLNFLLFASYNYVLNYIDFGNFVTSASGAEMHKFSGGIKGFFANIIRFCTMFFDFTGMPFGVAIWRITVSLGLLVMALCGIQPDTNILIPDTKYFELGNNFENMCGLGVLSFLLFVPSVIFALKKICHSKRTLIVGSVALGFLLNVVILAASLGYLIFSVRFIMFFVMIASPVMVYMFLSKKHKGYKKLLAVVMIYSFTLSYYFYERRFSPYLMYVFYKHPSVEKFKEQILCANVDYDKPSQACRIFGKVKQDEGNLLYFANSGTNIYYPKHSETEKYKLDIAFLDTANEDNIDWEKYLYIAVPNVQMNTNLQNIEKYKKAVTVKQNGNNVSYEYNQKVLADCVFVNFREPKKMLLFSNEESKITSSRCHYNPEVLKKHGFELIEQIDSYDNTVEERINLYKKVK